MIREFQLRLIDVLGRTGNRHAVVIGLGVLAVVAAITWVVVGSVNSKPLSDPYRAHAIVPAEAPILRPGSEVRVAGRRAGQVHEVEPAHDGRKVTFHLDSGVVGQDALALVRQRGFSGTVYLALTRGATDRPMPEGGTIPRSRTATNEDLSAVVSAFDDETRDALGTTLSAYGGGLIDRGEDINPLVADLPPLSRAIVPVLKGLAPAPDELSGLLRALDGTARGLAAPGRRDLAQLLEGAASTLGALGDQRKSLGRLIDETRPFADAATTSLPLASGLLGDAEVLASRLEPAVRHITASLPAVNALLLRDEDLGELGRFGTAAAPVLEPARGLVRELLPIGLTLGPLADPFRPFARYLDPYRDEMVETMRVFNEWSKFKYSEGLASGAQAVRFGPVFTCHQPRRPYAPPGRALRDGEELSGTEAC